MDTNGQARAKFAWIYVISSRVYSARYVGGGLGVVRGFVNEIKSVSPNILFYKMRSSEATASENWQT